MEKHLHIVCHDVPYPADYGGVFDLFYKIRALHKAGVKIHLHCFEYGRGRQPELDKYCEEVHYYQRRQGVRALSLSVPYIVKSRRDPALLKRLLQDNHPVLFEGVHTTWLLQQGALGDRKCFVRMHNVEYQYYRQLCGQTASLFKKLYFRNESRLLKKYEQKLAAKAFIIAVTEKEADWYRKYFHAPATGYIPVFVGWDEPLCKTGAGNFCLYQGNLSVPENERAVCWLLQNVFNSIDVSLVIAGRKPSPKLRRLISANAGVCLVADPSEDSMQELISKAQVNILPSFSDTGIKLKLLNAVFCGKHVLANKAMVEGTHLAAACHLADTKEEYKKSILLLMDQVFTEEEIQLRKNLLKQFYNNDKGAAQLIAWIW